VDEQYVIKYLTGLGAWDRYTHKNMVACINQLVEHYENKSCESCNHSEYTIYDMCTATIKCNKLEDFTIPSVDFYCKYWETKDG